MSTSPIKHVDPTGFGPNEGAQHEAATITAAVSNPGLSDVCSQQPAPPPGSVPKRTSPIIASLASPRGAAAAATVSVETSTPPARATRPRPPVPLSPLGLQQTSAAAGTSPARLSVRYPVRTAGPYTPTTCGTPTGCRQSSQTLLGSGTVFTLASPTSALSSPSRGRARVHSPYVGIELSATAVPSVLCAPQSPGSPVGSAQLTIAAFAYAEPAEMGSFPSAQSGCTATSTNPPERNVCRHFLEGKCNRGSACRFDHPGSKHRVVAAAYPRTPTQRPITPLADLERQRQRDALMAQQQRQQAQQQHASSHMTASSLPNGKYSMRVNHSSTVPAPGTMYAAMPAGTGVPSMQQSSGGLLTPNTSFLSGIGSPTGANMSSSIPSHVSPHHQQLQQQQRSSSMLYMSGCGTNSAPQLSSSPVLPYGPSTSNAMVPPALTSPSTGSARVSQPMNSGAAGATGGPTSTRHLSVSMTAMSAPSMSTSFIDTPASAAGSTRSASNRRDAVSTSLALLTLELPESEYPTLNLGEPTSTVADTSATMSASTAAGSSATQMVGGSSAPQTPVTRNMLATAAATNALPAGVSAISVARACGASIGSKTASTTPRTGPSSLTASYDGQGARVNFGKFLPQQQHQTQGTPKSSPLQSHAVQPSSSTCPQLARRNYPYERRLAQE